MKNRKILKSVLSFILILSMLITSSSLTRATEQLQRDIDEFNETSEEMLSQIEETQIKNPMYEDNNVIIEMEGANVSEDLTLRVTPVTQSTYIEAMKTLASDVAQDGNKPVGQVVYDIALVDSTGKEVHLGSNNTLKFTYKEGFMPANVSESDNASVRVMQYTEDPSGKITNVSDLIDAGRVDDLQVNASNEIESAEVQAANGKFSIAWIEQADQQTETATEEATEKATEATTEEVAPEATTEGKKEETTEAAPETATTEEVASETTTDAKEETTEVAPETATTEEVAPEEATTGEKVAEETTEEATAEDEEKEEATEEKTEEELAKESEKPRTYTHQGALVDVTVDVPAGVVLSKDAELVVEPLATDAENYYELLEKVKTAIEKQQQTIDEVKLYDIHFEVNGEEVEPEGGNVTVKFSYKNNKYRLQNDSQDMQIVHITDEGKTEVIKPEVETKTETTVESDAETKEEAVAKPEVEAKEEATVEPEAEVKEETAESETKDEAVVESDAEEVVEAESEIVESIEFQTESFSTFAEVMANPTTAGKITVNIEGLEDGAELGTIGAIWHANNCGNSKVQEINLVNGVNNITFPGPNSAFTQQPENNAEVSLHLLSLKPGKTFSSDSVRLDDIGNSQTWQFFTSQKMMFGDYYVNLTVQRVGQSDTEYTITGTVLSGNESLKVDDVRSRLGDITKYGFNVFTLEYSQSADTESTIAAQNVNNIGANFNYSPNNCKNVTNKIKIHKTYYNESGTPANNKQVTINLYNESGQKVMCKEVTTNINGEADIIFGDTKGIENANDIISNTLLPGTYSYKEVIDGKEIDSSGVEKQIKVEYKYPGNTNLVINHNGSSNYSYFKEYESTVESSGLQFMRNNSYLRLGDKLYYKNANGAYAEIEEQTVQQNFPSIEFNNYFGGNLQALSEKIAKAKTNKDFVVYYVDAKKYFATKESPTLNLKSEKDKYIIVNVDTSNITGPTKNIISSNYTVDGSDTVKTSFDDVKQNELKIIWNYYNYDSETTYDGTVTRAGSGMTGILLAPDADVRVDGGNHAGGPIIAKSYIHSTSEVHGIPVLDEESEVIEASVVNRTVSDNPEKPFIRIQKTFKGLTNPESQLPGYKIEVKNSNGNTIVATLTIKDSVGAPIKNEDGSLTFTWEVEGLEGTQYQIKEINATVDGFLLNATVNGEDLPESGVTVTVESAPYQIVGDLERYTPCSSLDLKLDTDMTDNTNIAIIELTEKKRYIVWSKDKLSTTQREAMKAALGKTNDLKNKIDAPEYTVDFYSGFDSGESSIPYQEGVTVKKEADGTHIYIKNTSIWTKFYYGTYCSTSPQNADIKIENEYGKSLEVTKQWIGEPPEDTSIFAGLYKVTTTGSDSSATKTYTPVSGKWIELSEENSWKGTFTLTDNSDYIVRELQQVASGGDFTINNAQYSAVEENANAIIAIGDNSYQVTYKGLEKGQDDKLEAKIINTLVDVPIKLKKVGTSDENKLTGAKFSLKKGSIGEDGKWQGDTNVQLSPINMTTSTVSLSNLIPGAVYELRETEAPAGFSCLTKPIYINVDSESGELSVTLMEESVGGTLTAGSNNIIPKETNSNIEASYMCSISVSTGSDSQTKEYTITVRNEALYELPQSGGSGIFVYTIGGILCMLGAALIIIKSKEKMWL